MTDQHNEHANEDNEHGAESGEFRELLKYTVSGYIGGLGLAWLLDTMGLHRSGIGQWLVRTLSGEGESLFEGLYAFRRRVARQASSMAEAYGWGKFFGMTAPWFADLGSRLAGVDMYGVESFYVPYFYAMSDQIGATLSGFIFLRRQSVHTTDAMRAYLRHPVMLASMTVVLIVPIGLLAVRLSGFSPATQMLTAAETIIANLCWVPPLAGWMAERRADGK